MGSEMCIRDRVLGVFSFDEFDVCELHGKPGLLLRVPDAGELHDRVRMSFAIVVGIVWGLPSLQTRTVPVWIVQRIPY